MPTTIRVADDLPLEQATLLVTFGPFLDETGASVTPSSATWTLTDRAIPPNVINNRTAVTATPGTSIAVLLRGDDLALLPGGDNRRALLLEWVYDSSNGTGLPGKDVLYFEVQALDGVS